MTSANAHQRLQQWQMLFVDRIYQLCNAEHPGMGIDRDAVFHVRDIVTKVVTELLDARPSCIADFERHLASLLPQQASGIIETAYEFMSQWSPRKLHSGRTATAKTLSALLHKLSALVKEYFVCKDKEKRDREKEVERLSTFLLSMCDYITQDILKWTGHYVKNIRNGQMTISLQNLQIALNADKNLMELTEVLHNEEEEGASATGSFLFDFEWGEDEQIAAVDNEQTYEKVARDFVHDENQYVANLSLLANVFRRRFSAVLSTDDTHYLDDIFGNVTELHGLTMQVERLLEDAVEMSDQPCLGMGLWQLAEAHEFNCYVEYMRTITTTMQGTIEKLLKDPKYSHFFDAEERVYSSSQGAQTFRLTVKYVLPSLLQQPIVHFYRYIDYVTRLLRLCTIEEDRIDLQNVKNYFSPLIARLDAQLTTELKKMIKLDQNQRTLNDSPISQLERLQEIQRKIDGYVGNSIGQSCSELVKEGDVQVVRPSLSKQPIETLRRGRWLTDRHVFLFDHLLVLCKMHKTVLKFKARQNIRTTEMFDLEDTDEVKNAFRIESTEKGSNVTFTFVCRSHEEKECWMSSILMLQTKSILDRLLDNYRTEEQKRIPLVTPGPEQYRFAEPDTEENIAFEDYLWSSGIPVVKHGTVTKLVERLTYHLYTDTNYVKTFLIAYRSFCSPSELLSLLIERFEVPIPAKLQPQPEVRANAGGPLAGRYDTVQSHGLSAQTYTPQPVVNYEQNYQRFRKEYERPIQRRVLAVMHQWVKLHWYDFESDSGLGDDLVEFLKKSCESGRLTAQHRRFAKSIMSTIEKKRCCVQSNSTTNGTLEGHSNGAFEPDEPGLQPVQSPKDPSIGTFQKKPPEPVWHTAQKGDIQNYDLLTLHPLEIGRQLTLLHFDLYRAIKPIELVGAAWMKSDKFQKSPQLLKLTNHSNQLTYWVSRSIVETDSFEERTAMLSRTLEVMSVFEELHNFTGLVAFYSALNSTCVHRLKFLDDLDNEKRKCYARFEKLCNPHWHEMMKRLQSVDPPCVPFFGHYLTSIVFFEGGNSTFVSPPKDLKHDLGDPGSTPSSARVRLVSFMKCRRIAGIISEIQMYQNQPYCLAVEPSLRQFFESINLQADFEDEDALQNYLYDRSQKIHPKNEADRPPEVKPKRPPHVLRSPGIKPPKHSTQANHYSPSSSNQLTSGSGTVPSTPSPGPRSAVPYVKSPTEDAHFALVDIQPGQHPKYLGDVSRRQAVASTSGQSPIGPLGPVPKKVLAPPPLHPRRNRPSNLTSPPPRSPLGAPPLFPRRQTISPPSANAGSSHAKSPRLSAAAQPQTFVFPDLSMPAVTASPPLPPRIREQQTSPCSSAEHRVILPVPESSTPRDDHSPTVSVSLQLPPQLPPPRVRHSAAAPPLPPPRPPKPSRYSTSPHETTPTANSTPAPETPPAVSPPAPEEAPVPPTLDVPVEGAPAPPPLPPKTYKGRKQSSSPTS